MKNPPNLTYIKNLADGDAAFEAKFINILKKELPTEQLEYTQHIEAKRHAEAAEMVHKLKHKLNILSMANAYHFAVTYEEALKAGNSAMHPDFETILNTVQTYLKTI